MDERDLQTLVESQAALIERLVAENKETRDPLLSDSLGDPEQNLFELLSNNTSLISCASFGSLLNVIELWMNAESTRKLQAVISPNEVSQSQLCVSSRLIAVIKFSTPFFSMTGKKRNESSLF